MKEVSLISILMTAYNREKYISFAIESVLKSTYSNFELIVVDDCSKDKTVEIARRYEAIDKRVKVYVNEHNLGDYPNRNKAASYALGKYLKYLDSDDYIYPYGIEILVDMMEQFPEAGWGLCSLWPDDKRPFPICLSPKESYEYHYFGPGLFHKAPGSSIILKKTFEEIAGFRPERMSGDNEMWHRLALKYSVVLMPDGIIWNRLNLGHESELSFVNNHAHQYEKIKWDYLKNKENPLTNSQKKIIQKKEFKKSLRYILTLFAKLKIRKSIIYLQLLTRRNK